MPQRAQVAEAEDAFAVGHDDHAHVRMRPVAQDLRDAAAFADADEKAARAAEDGAIFEAGLADGRRVDDGDHLLGMLLHQPVEERLVAILQGGEEDVLLERIRLAPEIAVDALQLFLDREHPRRQQAAQSQRVALAFGERRALVEQGVGQQGGSRGHGQLPMGTEALIRVVCGHAGHSRGHGGRGDEKCACGGCRAPAARRRHPGGSRPAGGFPLRGDAGERRLYLIPGYS